MLGTRRYALYTPPPAAPAAAPTYDADASLYFAALTTPPTDTYKNAVNTFILARKADGSWSLFDWLVCLAAETQQASLVNMKNPAKSMSAVGAVGTEIIFTASRGWKGDAVAGYLSFGEAYAAAGNQFAQNNATAGVYCNQQNGSSSSTHMSDLEASFIKLRIVPTTGGSNETFRINDSSATVSATSTTRTGHRGMVRRDSANKHAYRNGALIASVAVASATVSAQPGILLRGATQFSPDQLAFAYSGAALSDAQMANLHTDLVTMLTVFGAN